MVADNLPSPADVANFIVTKTIFDSVKIFDTNPTVLQAFANTNITMTVTVPNSEIPNLSNGGAAAWVNTNIRPFHPQTKIKYISVGNEVSLLNDPALSSVVVPAMRALTDALREAGPQFQDIKVTTAQAFNMFEGDTVPSLTRFRTDQKSYFEPLLQYLRETKTPLMVNPYPYFAVSAMETNVDFFIFRKTLGLFDGNSGKVYSNALDVLLDKTYSAMLAAGFGDVDIVMSETGWPSAGDPGNAIATIDNAASYNRHLIRKIDSGIGTPLMPNRKFEAYIFGLFNENQKPGALFERNWGLFQPDFTPVYVSGALRDGPPPKLDNPDFTVIPRTNFCVPKPGVPDDQLQKNLDYACSQGADCSPIQPGAVCADPATVSSHAKYAMDSYFRTKGVDSACDFPAPARSPPLIRVMATAAIFEGSDEKDKCMKDLSWNVRGMGSVVKLKAFRRILFEQKLEIAFIQETKEEAISEEEISSMWYDVEFGSQVSLWYDEFEFRPPLRVREKVKGVVVIIRGLVTMKQAVDAFIEAGWVGVSDSVLETNSRVVLFFGSIHLFDLGSGGTCLDLDRAALSVSLIFVMWKERITQW
ncbi:hypothetical protein V6N12_073105 [Hibiscus sabdariffa]|uniref:glucan endo-1,3-beta-D-glucosidase n=1 Tax=Hibiscus sabdariffa TaxID=183260 RepID=A0ABR2AG18_9ROSI